MSWRIVVIKKVAKLDLQLGLFHDNIFNPFNLASDLIEPFRILVDKQVIRMEFTEFGHEQKM